ncbi:hypothetical protein [Neptunomonas antarctica]|uniref:Universal stress protein B n=1 Tax=Neptunomonas antarctica TaxID=619304 RepID=A0A1N7LYS0_9GAMM|nr:hypothetical protein [Neptunomonas antarctica]SIS78976.1 hypothetical protein SAMN05421760_1051 [Neptunomonas antarctica]
MESIIVILFLASLVGMGFFLIKYLHVLAAIVDCSNASGVEIFGAHYKNVYHLMADVRFLNTLWVKGCHEQVADSQLSTLVAKAHRMLRAGVLIGLLIFFVPLINAVVKIGA